jgi:hypothetical protein
VSATSTRRRRVSWPGHILIVWFGIKAALFAAQGFGGFHFAKFADLILMISLGLGMLTYYSTPIPGTSYSFSDHTAARA